MAEARGVLENTMVQYVHITKVMHTLQIVRSITLRRLFRMECAALTRPSPERR